MYCPSCGAVVKQQDQRYCQECGTTLPGGGGRATAMVHQPSGGLQVTGAPTKTGLLHLLPTDMRNRALIGAGAVVLAVFLLYIVVNAIVSFFIHLVLPAAVVLAVLYAGYRYLRAKAS